MNSGGTLKPEESSQFLQAYALLQYHLVNAEQYQHFNAPTQHTPNSSSFQTALTGNSSGSERPVLSILSALLERESQGQDQDSQHGMYLERSTPFSASDLLYVMKRLTAPVTRSETRLENTYADFRPTRPENVLRTETLSAPYRTLSYFQLCREVGVRAMNEMIRLRILDLRWTRSVSLEEVDQEEDPDPKVMKYPVVLPTSPVMRCAMEKVVIEYEMKSRSLKE